MAKYKPYSYAQRQIIPVFFNKQIQKGTFEYSLNYLIDNELDLSIFDGCFCNDQTGSPAYDPRILLKIILFGSSRGITSRREIAKCCEENIVFMAFRQTADRISPPLPILFPRWPRRSTGSARTSQTARVRWAGKLE